MNPFQEESVDDLYSNIVHAAMAEGHDAVGYQYTTTTADIPAGTEVAVLVVKTENEYGQGALPIAIIPPCESPTGLLPYIGEPDGEVHQGRELDLVRETLEEVFALLPPELRIFGAQHWSPGASRYEPRRQALGGQQDA